LVRQDDRQTAAVSTLPRLPFDLDHFSNKRPEISFVEASLCLTFFDSSSEFRRADLTNLSDADADGATARIAESGMIRRPFSSVFLGVALKVTHWPILLSSE
jgi:hypothetical protein